MRRITWALLVLVLVLGGPAAARAADMCFGYDDLSNLLIAKAFVLPTAGNCKPFNGFFADTTWPVSGTVCGTSDNTKIRFNLRYSKFRDANGTFSADAVGYLNRSNLEGAIEFIFTAFPQGNSPVFFKKVACPVLSDRPLN